MKISLIICISTDKYEYAFSHPPRAQRVRHLAEIKTICGSKPIVDLGSHCCVPSLGPKLELSKTLSKRSQDGF